MKLNERLGQKWRYGTRSAGIVAAVLAVVILVNLLFGILCSDHLWYLDMTSENMYRLKGETVHYLEETLKSANENSDTDEPVEVEIIFCADPDLLIASSMMRYVYYTALQMQKAFPDSIKVSTLDVWDNPSSVNAYRTNSYASIYQTNVIVASGSEFRIYTQKSFYTYDDDTSTTPWAYNGEKMFLSGITAVTRAEAPICALTTNHGEPFATEEGSAEYSSFLNILEDAGYDVITLDLEKDEIPADCRLIITFDPQTDFASKFQDPSLAVSETVKLESWLNAHNSYMVFVDADTPKLPNLEEYLEEWGIAFDRYQGTDDAGNKVVGNYLLADPQNALNAEGIRLIGQYETEALGGSLTKNMREKGGSPKVVFDNALSLRYSNSYDIAYYLAEAEQNSGSSSSGGDFTYGTYYRNGRSRGIYDVFRTGSESFAYAKSEGERLTDADGNLLQFEYDVQDPFRLMTITRQTSIVGEGQGYTTVDQSSYVCAVGSTAFASNAVLSEQYGRSYGNTDVLLAALRQIGREIEPVGISFKPLYSDDIDAEASTTGANTVWTVFLVLIPAVTLTACGTVILIRRKVRS